MRVRALQLLQHALPLLPVGRDVLRRHCVTHALLLAQVQTQPQTEDPLRMLLVHEDRPASGTRVSRVRAGQVARLSQHTALKVHRRVSLHGLVHAVQLLQARLRQHLEHHVEQYK
jgi:hypothetical protein